MAEELKPFEIILEELQSAKDKLLLTDDDTAELEQIFLPLGNFAIKACNSILDTLQTYKVTTSFQEALQLLAGANGNVTELYNSFYSSYVALGFATNNKNPTSRFKGYYSGSWVSLYERYSEKPENVSLNKKKFKTLYFFLRKNKYLMQYGQGYGKAIFLMDTPELKIDTLFPIIFKDDQYYLNYISENLKNTENTAEPVKQYMVQDLIQRNQELDNENRLLKLKIQDLQDGFL